MITKSRIALATLLVVCASSIAMTQSNALNDDATAASQASRAPLLTVAAWRASARSAHLRPRQSRNAGLGTGEYAPRSGQQAPEPGYGGRGVLRIHNNDDNYQYWHQACCL